ncbi:LysR substrate-binding domain-containing protein [Caulobacter sp.]|uniref:LysR substrate-binding domain-containing protein n=1 Tax=Caulobacter sp. TaxID=78 RepID=UPI0031DDED64
MLRQTPSLEAAEAFLVAARAPSFRAGAAELALSPSAFSRRIQLLENFVGAPLFDRSGPTPRLTDLGACYLDEIAPALEVIRRATRRLRAADSAVRVSASHSFAVTWLMPRLTELRAAGLEVELIIRQGLDGLRDGQADLAICGGDTAPAEFASDVLVELDAFVVSAPTPAGGASLARIDDLSAHALLTTTGGANLWSRWFEQVGRPAATPRPTPPLPTLQAMYEAAANGLGLALAVPLASERLLAEGRLVRRLPLDAPIGQQYRVVYAERPRGRRPAQEAFVGWLKSETAASSDRFRRTPVTH